MTFPLTFSIKERMKKETGMIVMTNFLLRLFVKDYDNTESAAVHSAIGKLAGLTGIVCNLLLFLGKLTVGWLANSVSIIADAVNNLSDASSSVVTLLGFKMAQQPADAEHPYGHARYEYLSGLVVAALILIIGVDLAKSSLQKIDPSGGRGVFHCDLRGAAPFHCGEALDGRIFRQPWPSDSVHHTAGDFC